MEGKYIPALITLVAGLVSLTICLIKGVRIIRSLVILLIVLIIFYIVGRLVKFVLVKTLEEKFEDDMEPEDDDEDNADTEETTDVKEAKDTKNTQDANRSNEG